MNQFEEEVCHRGCFKVTKFNTKFCKSLLNASASNLKYFTSNSQYFVQISNENLMLQTHKIAFSYEFFSLKFYKNPASFTSNQQNHQNI